MIDLIIKYIYIIAIPIDKYHIHDHDIHPASIYMMMHIYRLQRYHSLVAVVSIFACKSTDISGIALYICIATHRQIHANIYIRFIFSKLHTTIAYPYILGMTYSNELNITSRIGTDFALIGFAL